MAHMADPFPRLNKPVKAVYPVPPEDLPDLGDDHTFKTMAVWNRVRGVGKTTICHTLGFAYAFKGRRVLMVDADPQCDLSCLLLQEWVRYRQSHEATKNGIVDYNLFFDHKVDGCTNKNNLWTALENVIQYSDDGDALGEWGPADVTKIDLPATCTGALYLLPGHQDVSAYEQKVSVAYSSKLNFEPATPGAWNKLITLTAHKCGADVVIVDCNPHVGALNMHIVLTSDYLFLPCTPDFHSHDAIKSLPPVLRGWAITRKAARTTLVHSDELASDLQIPGRNPRILGASIMKFTHRNGRLARSFGYWTDLIQNALRAANTTIHATPALDGMAGNPEEPDTWPSILVDMPDFCSLGALSHYYGLPVFALGPDLMGDWNADTGAMQSYGGHVKAGMNKSVMDFQALFKSFIQKVGSKVARGPFQVSFVDGNINEIPEGKDEPDAAP